MQGQQYQQINNELEKNPDEDGQQNKKIQFLEKQIQYLNMKQNKQKKIQKTIYRIFKDSHNKILEDSEKKASEYFEQNLQIEQQNLKQAQKIKQLIIELQQNEEINKKLKFQNTELEKKLVQQQQGFKFKINQEIYEKQEIQEQTNNQYKEQQNKEDDKENFQNQVKDFQEQIQQLNKNIVLDDKTNKKLNEIIKGLNDKVKILQHQNGNFQAVIQQNEIKIQELNNQRLMDFNSHSLQKENYNLSRQNSQLINKLKSMQGDLIKMRSKTQKKAKINLKEMENYYQEKENELIRFFLKIQLPENKNTVKQLPQSYINLSSPDDNNTYSQQSLSNNENIKTNSNIAIDSNQEINNMTLNMSSNKNTENNNDNINQINQFIISNDIDDNQNQNNYLKDKQNVWDNNNISDENNNQEQEEEKVNSINNIYKKKKSESINFDKEDDKIKQGQIDGQQTIRQYLEEQVLKQFDYDNVEDGLYQEIPIIIKYLVQLQSEQQEGFFKKQLQKCQDKYIDNAIQNEQDDNDNEYEIEDVMMDLVTASQEIVSNEQKIECLISLSLKLVDMINTTKDYYGDFNNNGEQNQNININKKFDAFQDEFDQSQFSCSQQMSFSKISKRGLFESMIVSQKITPNDINVITNYSNRESYHEQRFLNKKTYGENAEQLRSRISQDFSKNVFRDFNPNGNNLNVDNQLSQEFSPFKSLCANKYLNKNDSYNLTPHFTKSDIKSSGQKQLQELQQQQQGYQHINYFTSSKRTVQQMKNFSQQQNSQKNNDNNNSGQNPMIQSFEEQKQGYLINNGYNSNNNSNKQEQINQKIINNNNYNKPKYTDFKSQFNSIIINDEGSQQDQEQQFISKEFEIDNTYTTSMTGNKSRLTDNDIDQQNFQSRNSLDIAQNDNFSEQSQELDQNDYKDFTKKNNYYEFNENENFQQEQQQQQLLQQFNLTNKNSEDRKKTPRSQLDDYIDNQCNQQIQESFGQINQQ